MKIIITGATSFIGSSLTKRLIADGHDVYAVVRPNSVHGSRIEGTGAKIIYCDITDIEKLLQAKTLYDSDIWFQFGWGGSGSNARLDAELQHRNVTDCEHSLDVAAQLGCKKYIFSGSQAEYGICHEKTDENHKCLPLSEYGRAKLKFHDIASDKCKKLGMQYYHLRIFSVYGPNDHEHSLVSSCIKNFKSNKDMEFGACEQKWNFIYIDDCVDAIARLAVCDAEEGIYNIASDDTRVLKEFISEIKEVIGGDGTLKYGVRKPNAEGDASLIPDIHKIKNALNWSAAVSFREGILRC